MIRTFPIIFNYQYFNHYQDRLNWPRWKKEACFWTLYVVLSIERLLPNIQGIRYIPGRGTLTHGQPRLCTSVASIWGKRRRSGVLLWVGVARTGMFHVSTWNLFDLLV